MDELYITFGRQVCGWFCAGLIIGSFYTSHKVAIIIGGLCLIVILFSYSGDDR